MTGARALLLLLAGGCASGPSPGASRAEAMREGGSCESPVAIDADRESAGAAAERAWLEKHHPGATISGEKIVTCGGRPAKIFLVDTVRGTTVRVYFDISKYYGKF